jgi:hypothetical protein|tara:strand:- start:338 stop:487 length:150 start_codon:yes stop_codon:yes gene_type:complete
MGFKQKIKSNNTRAKNKAIEGCVGTLIMLPFKIIALPFKLIAKLFNKKS